MLVFEKESIKEIIRVSQLSETLINTHLHQLLQSEAERRVTFPMWRSCSQALNIYTIYKQMLHSGCINFDRYNLSTNIYVKVVRKEYRR